MNFVIYCQTYSTSNTNNIMITWKTKIQLSTGHLDTQYASKPFPFTVTYLSIHLSLLTLTIPIFQVPTSVPIFLPPIMPSSLVFLSLYSLFQIKLYHLYLLPVYITVISISKVHVPLPAFILPSYKEVSLVSS